jgi:hypothetical protein
MKKIKIIYWISTGLFAAFLFITSIPYLYSSIDVTQLIHDQLGYPIYIIPLLGMAKIIGSIILVIPGLVRIKEWAYAGLMIDLIGAMFSLLMIGGGIQAVIGMGIPILVGVVSYIYHHKILKATTLTPAI